MKYSRVIEKRPGRQNEFILVLECGHTVSRTTKQCTAFKRVRCEHCYPPENKPRQAFVPRRNSAWDAVRQTRGSRRSMKNFRRGTGPRY